MSLLRRTLKQIGYVLAAFIFVVLVLLVIPEREVVPAITPTEDTRYWDMSEGFKIAYRYRPSTADTVKTPIVYLHGGPGGYIHSSIADALGELNVWGYTVYLYDQRGSGLSDRLERFSDVNIEKHLADLNEIIVDKIAAGPVVLMGQSFGANIIAQYAARHPENVARLIFASPGPISPPLIENGRYVRVDSLYPTPDSLQFIAPINPFSESNRAVMKPKALVATTGALLFDKKLISDKQMDRILNTMASSFTKGMVCNEENARPEEGGGGLYAYMGTNNDNVPDMRADMAVVEAPALVIQGQCDYIGFGYAYEYVDVFPNARYEFVEGAGHVMWWEQKESFIAEVRDFLEEE